MDSIPSGRIREKYRFMMETYRNILDLYDDRYWYKAPGVAWVKPLHLIMSLEMMHYLELEIDKLIDVLIDEGTEDLKTDRKEIGQTEPPAWWKKGETTKYTDISNFTKKETFHPIEVEENRYREPPVRLRSQKDIQLEEKEKSLLRQRFLMKKLGMSPNMTTLKKRFLRHWPVEDSWKLDKYNYDYK